MEKHEIDILLQSTVRIECLKKNGDFAYGTGAFFPFTEPGLDGAVVTIITNRHVVKDSSRIRFYLTPIDSDGNPDLENYQPVIVEDAESLIIYHDNDDVDIAAIPIGGILNRINKESHNFLITCIDKKFVASQQSLNSLSSMEEIIMIGYPSGLWDSRNNLPLIRKGVTSSHPSLGWGNKKQFVIDAACYEGSSGSPVFIRVLENQKYRYAYLGTLYAGHTQKIYVKKHCIINDEKIKENEFVRVPINTGLVICAEEVWNMEEAVLQRTVRNTLSRNSKCPCGSGKRYKSCCGTTH